MNNKIASDIKFLLEDDAKYLTEAMLMGEISPANRPLSDYFTEQEIHKFSADILRHQFSRKFFSSILPYLATMKWLSLNEACVYSRKSRNTLIKLINENKISGSKPEGSGDFIVDRESIDAYYNSERDKLRIKFPSRRVGHHEIN